MLRTVDHPLIADEMTRLRDPQCGAAEFRQRVRRIASLMVPAVTAELPTRPVECLTPLESATGRVLANNITLVPVMRAGLAFVDGFLDMIPHAAVAHIGLMRDEHTLEARRYYLKHPPRLEDHDVIVLDPMLATGGSAVEAVTMMKGAGARSLRFACLVAAPEGIATLLGAFPGLPVHAAALDRCLDENGYILPGLGDAGDRMFGTSP
jgi:uracil phosphoribosyltransferase